MLSLAERSKDIESRFNQLKEVSAQREVELKQITEEMLRLTGEHRLVQQMITEQQQPVEPAETVPGASKLVENVVENISKDKK